MNKRNEKISAFLDGGIHRDELMSFSLSSEDSDTKVVMRYQIIGDALRDELSEASFVDVSAAVRESLANENIAGQVNTVVHEHADDAASTSILDSLFNNWLRPAAGLAMAASVAVIMVSIMPEGDSTDERDAAIVPVAKSEDTQPTPVVVRQLASQPATMPVVAGVQATRSVPVSAATRSNMGELDPYLNQHLDYATRDTLQSRMPYVRSVSYETRQPLH
jgi:negative regulator of sigma E activity